MCHSVGVLTAGRSLFTEPLSRHLLLFSACSHPRYIWDAVSHELGHAVGLSHDTYTDSNGLTQYYPGQGDWASIMGVSYYKTLTHFDKGEYTGAKNTQVSHSGTQMRLWQPWRGKARLSLLSCRLSLTLMIVQNWYIA